MSKSTLITTLLGACLISWGSAFAAGPAEKSEGFSGRFSASYQLMLKAAVGWDDYDDQHPKGQERVGHTAVR